MEPPGTPGLARRPVTGPEFEGALQSTPSAAVLPPHERHRPGPERFTEPDLPAALDAVLDPLLCQMAVQPGITPAVELPLAGTGAPAALPLHEDLQNLLTGLARRVAWGGDRRKGSARIELGEGALAGATLVVHAEEREVRVDIELPAGAGSGGWPARIAERLEARGFSAQVRVG